MATTPFLVKLFDAETEFLGQDHLFEVDALSPLDAISKVVSAVRPAGENGHQNGENWHAPMGLTAILDPAPDPHRPEHPRLV
jgi:hypothetical protein